VTHLTPAESAFCSFRDPVRPRDYALIEFMAPDDPMFDGIVCRRRTLYSHLTFAACKRAAVRRFDW
jgi:hypothetical protein